MLTNAYIVYLKVNEEAGIEKKKLLSQHDFRKEIAMTWISPKYYDDYKGKQVKRKTREITSFSSVSMQSLESRTCNRITNDDALLPLGKLGCRLDVEKDHLPMAKAGPTNQCAMHRWSCGEEVYSMVSFCPTCKVNLCIDCYRPFHYDRDLVNNKKLHCLKKQLTKKRKKSSGNK